MNNTKNTTTRRLPRIAAAVIIAGCVIAGAAAPVSAEKSLGSKTTTTTATAGSNTAPTIAAPTIAAPTLADLGVAANGGTLSPPALSNETAIKNQFRTLSAAMVNVYAAQNNMTVDQYFAANAKALSKITGGSVTMASLDGAFATRLGMSAGNVSSLVGSLQSGLATPDGAVTSAAIRLAATLAAIPTDGLNANAAGALTGAGSDSLLFGMLATRTMANFAGNFPDLFAQVSSSGLGTAGGLAAFAASRDAAAATLNQDLSGMMLNPCGASLLGAMSSGSVTGVGSQTPGCGSCVTAGAYMHSAMNRLTDPAGGATLQIPNGSVTTNEWNSLTDWQRNSILEANPGLADQLSAASNPQIQAGFSSASSACSTAQSGTANYMTNNLGSMFSQLAP